MFSSAANVRPTTHIEVLQAIATKIRADISVFSDPTVCFITDVPWPSIEVSDSIFCTIAPSDGQFDISLIDGSGNLGVVELSPVVVTIWSKIRVDQLERFEAGFTDPSRGLLALKGQVLFSLAGKNLPGGEYQGGNSSLLLLEPMSPSVSRNDPKKTEDDYAGLSITFDVKCHWGLGSTSQTV